MSKKVRLLTSVATAIVLLAILAVVFTGTVFADPDNAILDASVNTMSAQPGDVITVTFTLSNMDAAETFNNWQIRLGYNTAVLEVASCSPATLPGGNAPTCQEDPNSVIMGQGNFAGDFGPGPDFDFGTMAFTVTAMGSTNFTVITDTVADTDFTRSSDYSSWLPGTINVGQVTAAPDVQFSSATYEVDEGVGTATITATLSPTSTQPVTVSYATSNGTATVADGDYTAASGELNFAPNDQQQTFTVDINDDGDGETSETVNLTLSSPENANLGTPSAATLTILDNDCAPVSGQDFTYDPVSPLVNDTVTFTGTAAGTTPINYTWDLDGDGSPDKSGAVVTYTYTASNTYSVEMTASNSCPSQDSVTQDVTVITPEPDINVNPLSFSVSLDPDDTDSRTLTVENVGTANLTWTLAENPLVGWLDESSGGDTTTPGGIEDVTLDFDSTGMSPGIYNTTLEIDSNDPDEPTVNVPVTLTVGCVQVTGASFTYDPASPMVNDTVAFTASYEPPDATAPIAYDWSFNDGSTASGQMVNHSWTVSNTYRVLLTITNCSGAGVVQDSAVIDVPGLVDINVTPLELNATLNPGDDIVRQLTIQNAATATANLNWNLTESTAVGWLDEDPASGSTAPGGSDAVNVTFTAPAITDTYTTTLLIHSNDPDEDPVPVTATLVVTSGCIEVQNAGFDYSPTDPDAGEVVTFNGNVERGTEPVTYTWDFGGGDTPTGQTVTHTWDFSGTYNVSVNAENACGSDDFSDDVFVLGEPDIDVSPLTLNVMLEAGGNASRDLTIANAAGTTANLNWSLAENPDATWLSEVPSSGTASPGVSDTAAINFSAAGLTAGTYNTQLQVNSNDPDEGTVNVDVQLEVVTCVPVDGAAITLPSNPQVDQPATFTGTVNAECTHPIQYTWNFGDGTGEQQSGWIYQNSHVIQHTFAVSDTYTVVMTATNCAGANETTVSEDVSVPGTSVISVDPSSLSKELNPNIGAGQTMPEDLIISNGSGATADLTWTLVETPTVTWLDENIFSGVTAPGGDSVVRVTFNSTGLAPGSYNTTLQITSNDLDDPVVEVDVTLTVNTGCIPVDGAELEFTPTGPISPNTTVAFTGSVEQGSLPIEYDWDFGDGVTDENSDVWAQFHTTDHTYTDDEDGYSVRLTVRNSCGEATVSGRVGNPVIYLPLVVRNFVPPAPASIDALESNSPVNLGEPMYFTATVSGDEPITYTWDFDDDGTPEQSGVGLDTISYTYATTGTFTVALDVENEYGDDSTTLDVTVEQAFTAASITEVTSDSPVDLSEPMHFTATVEGTEPITYSWDFDGDGTPEQSGTDLATTTYTYTESGFYVVILEVENAWGSDDTVDDPLTVRVNATRAGLIGPLYSAIPASEAIVSAEAIDEPRG